MSEGSSELKASLQLGKTLYHQGDLSYFEAVNKETLKNAFQLFEEEGIVMLAKSKETKKSATIKLVPAWTPDRDAETGDIVPRGKLWDFIETIALSRREGQVFSFINNPPNSPAHSFC